MKKTLRSSITLVVAALATLPTNVAQAQTRIPWQKIPLLPPEAAKAGITPGGEGGQWPRWSVSISETEPNFLLLPIDVGGLYRSLDGGAHWEQTMEGWNARGANGFAIDPRNSSRVLGIGGNSLNWDKNWGQSPNGIYISTDKAGSWRQVLAVPDGTNGQIAFDPASYDAARGYCTVAFYAGPISGLFRSEDGGATWEQMNRLSTAFSDAKEPRPLLAVHPTNGSVYVGAKGGLFRSSDKGKTLERLWDGNIQGLSVIKSAPDDVYISGAPGILRSTDAGKTFTPLAATGVKRNPNEAIQNVIVSPANSKKMFCWVSGANWQWVRYLSEDGGNSFSPVKIESGVSNRDVSHDPNVAPGGFANLPFNTRQGYFSWHPTDPNIAYGLGGDWVTKSTDGGRLFKWSNNGYNGVMIGNSFGFSAHDPNTVLLGFQDYNGAYTNDGGKTWNYRDVSGRGWGGHIYGAYAVDKDVMWGGDAEGWGGKRLLRVSRDGGTKWVTAKDADGKIITYEGADVSYADPKNPNILFASNWRSADKGATWQAMPDCSGVFTSAPDGRLFGRKGKNLVASKNAGATWQSIVEVPGGFGDVAYDAKRDRFYFASEDRLKMVENGTWTTLNTPKDQYGATKVATVAVDPVVTDVVYVGGPRNIYASHATVARSTDAGATWENLTVGNGPHEVSWIRVHPTSREAWLNGQCYGMWRIAAPAELGAAPAERANATPVVKVATPKILPAPVPSLTLRNGDMSAGDAVPNNWMDKWGDVSSARDTEVFKSAPASLRVQTSGKSGAAFQLFDSGGGGVYTISGWVKSQGNVKVNAAVQAFDANWSRNQFFQMKYLQGDSDWQEFSQKITIPAWASRFNVQLLVDGTGRAWLDDVKLVQESAAASAPEPPAIPADVPRPAAEQSPIVPSVVLSREWPRWWYDTHLRFVKRLKDDPASVKVIFFGDSITEQWQSEGKASWEASFKPLGAVNFGIGGDKIQNLLWRVQNGEADGASPKLIVIKIGTNNVLGDKPLDETKAVAGIGMIVNELRKRQPQAKILLIGVPPSLWPGSDARKSALSINAKIAQLAAGPVRFVDLTDKLLAPDGALGENFRKDNVHLSAKGYQDYAAALLPIVREMLVQ